MQGIELHMLTIAPIWNTDKDQSIGFDDDDIVFQHHGFIRNVSPQHKIYMNSKNENLSTHKKSRYVIKEYKGKK